MKFVNRIYKQLKEDFPEIDRAVLYAVAHMVAGEADKAPLQATLAKLSGEVNDDVDYSEEDMREKIYETFLETAKNTCRNPERINSIQAEVAIIKQNTQRTPGSKTQSTTFPSSFDVAHSVHYSPRSRIVRESESDEVLKKSKKSI